MEMVNFNKDGLIPVIVQDVATKEVLMQAYMNVEALQKTLETGRAWYFSRSRNALWLKGETSGHFQDVVEIYSDCDNDCLLLKVKQTGVACHTGKYSCFFNLIKKNDEMEKSKSSVINELQALIADRKVNPQVGSYTNYLLEKGTEKIAKKVGEEACEVVIASMKRDKQEFVSETADLMYHLMVLLNDQGVVFEEVLKELETRR